MPKLLTGGASLARLSVYTQERTTTMSEKIALGLGDNTDYEIVWNSEVFEDLIRRHGIHASELAIDKPITSERDLVVSILGFLQAGTGGERHVAASAIVEEFARNFAMKITLGGTSVRAAIAMRKLGYTSALHLVTINEHVRRLIPQDSPYVCSNTVDSSFPHLIVQFDKGTHVRAGDIDICSSRANRIIYHDDTDNVIMRLNEEFGDLITGAKVFLVSGFNAMRDEQLLVDRLASLQRMHRPACRATPRSFLRMRATTTPTFTSVAVTTLAHRITIFSLNEDELQGHLGRTLDLLDASAVSAALGDLHKLIPVPIIVVHSMYWTLAYGDNAQSMAQRAQGRRDDGHDPLPLWRRFYGGELPGDRESAAQSRRRTVCRSDRRSLSEQGLRGAGRPGRPIQWHDDRPGRCICRRFSARPHLALTGRSESPRGLIASTSSAMLDTCSLRRDRITISSLHASTPITSSTWPLTQQAQHKIRLRRGPVKHDCTRVQRLDMARCCPAARTRS